MQLKRRGLSIQQQLAVASCALLGATTARAQDEVSAAPAEQAGDWSLDSALAYYHENGRVQAVEPIVEVGHVFANDDALDLKFTFDSLSGASPNGALTSHKPQTFASPSGKSSKHGTAQTYTTTSGMLETVIASAYTVAAGQLPVDPNYHDQRAALALGWDHQLDRLTVLSVGGKLSYEDDFLSGSVSAGIAHDFNDRNTTLSLSLNGEFDSIKPIGGTPVAASDYALFDKTTAADHKNGGGFILGLTQIITQHWLTELNLSADRFTGYLNDPYKIISVIDAAGDTSGYLYERRPEERTRRSAYLDNRFGWSRASLALSARYMTDDWGVRSYTAQARVRLWSSEKDSYWEPTVRWYRQSAADFYTPWLVNASGPVSFASSDQRLSAFTALTYGLKYGIKVYRSQELSVRFEYYQQTQRDRAAAPLALEDLDLYPGLKAILVQVGWKF